MIIQHKISLFVFPYAFEFKFNMFISPTKIVISFETTKLIRYFFAFRGPLSQSYETFLKPPSAHKACERDF